MDKTMHAWNLLKKFFALSIIFCGVIFSGCQQDSDSSLDASAVPVDSKNADFGTLFLHISELFNLEKEEDNIFVRWEGPVRFYLQGLENHPDLEAMFLRELNEMAKITGLDIKRHDDLYLHYQDPAKAKTGPDGHYTNITIFFAEDMEKAFQDPKVETVIKGFGDDPHEKYLLWKKHNEEGDNTGALSYKNHAFNAKEMQFYFIMIDSNYLSIELQENKSQQRFELFEIVSNVILNIQRSRLVDINSVYNTKSYENGNREKTLLDDTFLRAYYSNTVPSGITKRQAALGIVEKIAKDLNITK